MTLRRVILTILAVVLSTLAPPPPHRHHHRAPPPPPPPRRRRRRRRRIGRLMLPHACIIRLPARKSGNPMQDPSIGLTPDARMPPPRSPACAARRPPPRARAAAGPQGRASFRLESRRAPVNGRPNAERSGAAPPARCPRLPPPSTLHLPTRDVSRHVWGKPRCDTHAWRCHRRALPHGARVFLYATDTTTRRARAARIRVLSARAHRRLSRVRAGAPSPSPSRAHRPRSLLRRSELTAVSIYGCAAPSYGAAAYFGYNL